VEAGGEGEKHAGSEGLAAGVVVTELSRSR
jgi:hypothetical protein